MPIDLFPTSILFNTGCIVHKEESALFVINRVSKKSGREASRGALHQTYLKFQIGYIYMIFKSLRFDTLQKFESKT